MVQTAALDQLTTDTVASRLLDAEEKVADGKKLLILSERFDTLQNAVWRELRSGHDLPGMRCNLQREHLQRLANGLQAKIRAAIGKPISKEAKAHLAESLNTLSQALKTPLLRTSV